MYSNNSYEKIMPSKGKQKMRNENHVKQSFKKGNADSKHWERDSNKRNWKEM